MSDRRFAAIALAFTLGCTRSANEPPRLEAPTRDASPRESTSDAGTKPPARDALSMVMRAETVLIVNDVDEIGYPLPRIDCTSGGFTVGSGLTRAIAGSSGPLRAEPINEDGLELDRERDYGSVSSPTALRWVVSGPELTLVGKESASARVGPSADVFTRAAGRFEKTKSKSAYFSATRRGASIVALEAAIGSAPAGGGEEYTATFKKPARLRLLAGAGPAPALPSGVCAMAMHAAEDGTLLVAGLRCSAPPDAKRFVVVRYKSGTTTGLVESVDGAADIGEPIAVHAAADGDLYAARGATLNVWDGTKWTSSTPFGKGSRIASISRSHGGDLWFVVDLAGRSRLFRRPASGSELTPVPLPPPPSDPRAVDEYEAAGDLAFVKRTAASPRGEAQGRTELEALRVEATCGAEVLVLATAGVRQSVFVLSTRDRGEPLRVPSLTLQRVSAARVAKRTPSPDGTCPSAGFALLPTEATDEAVRSALGRTAGDMSIGEGPIEGQSRRFVWGRDVGGAMKRLTSVGAQLYCSSPPPVADRTTRLNP